MWQARMQMKAAGLLAGMQLTLWSEGLAPWAGRHCNPLLKVISISPSVIRAKKSDRVYFETLQRLCTLEWDLEIWQEGVLCIVHRLLAFPLKAHVELLKTKAPGLSQFTHAQQKPARVCYPSLWRFVSTWIPAPLTEAAFDWTVLSPAPPLRWTGWRQYWKLEEKEGAECQDKAEVSGREGDIKTLDPGHKVLDNSGIIRIRRPALGVNRTKNSRRIH